MKMLGGSTQGDGRPGGTGPASRAASGLPAPRGLWAVLWWQQSHCRPGRMWAAPVPAEHLPRGSFPSERVGGGGFRAGWLSPGLLRRVLVTFLGHCAPLKGRASWCSGDSSFYGEVIFISKDYKTWELFVCFQ